MMRGCLVLLIGAGLSLPANASPWIRPAGDTYLRLAMADEQVEGLAARRIDLYGETGLGGGWSLSAKAEHVGFESASDFNAEGYRLTLRRALFRRGPAVISAGVGAVHGAAIGGAAGCADTGAELRLGAGLSGIRRGRDWYAFADLSGRRHGDGCRRERVELGLGRELTSNLYLTQQVWIERGNGAARSDKMETGVTFTPDWGEVTLAWREEVSGRFSETGFVLALARRF